MVSKLTKVTNEMGFHMRPANVFVTAMTKYASNINIIVGDKNHPEVIGINGWCDNKAVIINDVKSEIDGNLASKDICIVADEQAMLDEAIALIESGFGE